MQGSIQYYQKGHFWSFFPRKWAIKFSAASIFNPILGVLQQNKLLHLILSRLVFVITILVKLSKIILGYMTSFVVNQSVKDMHFRSQWCYVIYTSFSCDLELQSLGQAGKGGATWTL